MKKPPAAVYAVLGALPHAFGYVVVPVRLARRGRRRGWTAGRPSTTNAVGLLPIGAGVALIGWAIASHYEETPADARVTMVPEYLVSRGAYAVSRNPLYAGGALCWLGWATFFGSARVAAVGTVWFTAIARFGVPFEERMLRERFGSAYAEYQARVPRWIAVAPRRAHRPA
jgi:protein-S-isoprenylcysteine O-methyltransferase Ste14